MYVNSQTEKRKIYKECTCLRDYKLLAGYVRETTSLNITDIGADIEAKILKFTDRISTCLCVSSINDSQNRMSDNNFVIEPHEVIQRNGQYVEVNPIMSEMLANEMMMELCAKN